MRVGGSLIDILDRYMKCLYVVEAKRAFDIFRFLGLGLALLA